MKQEKKKWSQAMTFIVLFGIVSLFSDMTHEGASSIRGAYLSLMGASAGMIGFVSGLGELVGYSMRYVFGKLTDKTKRYWPMTIFGYLLDVLAVPALALVGEHGWMWACALLIIQRMGNNCAAVTFPDFTRGYWNKVDGYKHQYAPAEEEAATEQLTQHLYGTY